MFQTVQVRNQPEWLVLCFFVYGGAGDALSANEYTSEVVLALMDDFLGQRHSIFTDNVYNS